MKLFRLVKRARIACLGWDNYSMLSTWCEWNTKRVNLWSKKVSIVCKTFIGIPCFAYFGLKLNSLESKLIVLN